MIRNNLNSICPYFAMFPLDYPLECIAKNKATRILDPFCGRGTTNMAARLNGLYSVGIDSSKVAFAISSAKMVDVSPGDVVQECEDILSSTSDTPVPDGEFWKMMYDGETLANLCKLRDSLLDDCESDVRIALRGIALGALHGPLRADGSTSYFSNQFPRTYASKPKYSVKYWKMHDLTSPPKVNITEIVKRRAERCYSEKYGPVNGFIINGDSTDPRTFQKIASKSDNDRPFDTVITSPP